MDTGFIINWLSVLVLLGFLVALVYLISMLYRVNRILNRVEHLSDTFRSFVSEIVPAIMNIGTIATALESVIRSLNSDHHAGKSHKDKAK